MQITVGNFAIWAHITTAIPLKTVAELFGDP